MIGKLRWKFIGISMLAVIIVISVVFLFFYFACKGSANRAKNQRKKYFSLDFPIAF